MKESSQEEACGTGLKDQQVLGVHGYAQLFHHSVERLRSQLIEKGEGAELVWDKVRTQKTSNVRYTLFIQWGPKLLEHLAYLKVQLNWPVQCP